MTHEPWIEKWAADLARQDADEGADEQQALASRRTYVRAMLTDLVLAPKERADLQGHVALIKILAKQAAEDLKQRSAPASVRDLVDIIIALPI